MTIHLADSLPKDVLRRLDLELKRLPSGKREIERRKRNGATFERCEERLLPLGMLVKDDQIREPGHGPSVWHDPIPRTRNHG